MCDFGCGGDPIQVLHWAIDADESHLCPNRTTTETRWVSSPISDPIMTANWRELTLTSPTAYVYFSTMRHDARCGSTHTNVLLPVIPEKVSTMYSNSLGQDDVKQMDYRHLAFTTIGSHQVPLVPLSAYLYEKNVCEYLADECQTVYHDYQPSIIYEFYPGALQSIDPAWEHCSGARVVNLDPPIALSPTVMKDNMITIHPILNSALPLSTDTSPPIATVDPLPRPRGAYIKPYAIETGSSQPVMPHDLAALRPGVEPGVVVSRISIFTIYASVIDAQGSLDGTMTAGAVHGNVLSQPANGAQHLEPGMNSGTPIFSVRTQQNVGVIFAQSDKEYTAKQVPSLPGNFIFEGSTLTVGGPAITVGGAVVSAFSSGIVIQNGATIDVRMDSSSFIDAPQQGSHEVVSLATTRKRKKSKGNRSFQVAWDTFWLGLGSLSMAIIYNCVLVSY
jgi:hypothetical protein